MTRALWDSNANAQEADALQKHEANARRRLAEIDAKIIEDEAVLHRMEKSAANLRIMSKVSGSALDQHIAATAEGVLEAADATILVKREMIASWQHLRGTQAGVVDLLKCYGDLPAPMPFEGTFRIALDKGVDPEAAAAAAAEADRIERMTPQEQAQHEIKKAYRNGYKVLS